MTAPYPATAAQQRVLRFIAGYQEAHGGVSPTLREIQAGVGASSTCMVHERLTALEERGHIARLPNRARAIRLLHPVSVPRTPDRAAPLFMVGGWG